MAPRWRSDHDGDGLDHAVDAAFGAAASEDAAFEVDTERLRAAAARLADTVAPPDQAPGQAPDRASDQGQWDAGLAGWSVGPVLARLDRSWTVAVTELAAEYADHADQLRAVADRYDDAERIVLRALSGTTPPVPDDRR
jgi:hypothetical protein